MIKPCVFQFVTCVENEARGINHKICFQKLLAQHTQVQSTEIFIEFFFNEGAEHRNIAIEYEKYFNMIM
jgi:hypothetical protein